MGSSRTARLAKNLFPNLPVASAPDMVVFLRNLRDWCNNAFDQLQLPEYDRTKNLVLVHSVTDGKVMWGGEEMMSSGQATLVGGTVVVLNASTTADCLIFLSSQTYSATAGHLGVSARSVGNSFTIQSSNASDVRTIGYLLIPVS